MLAPPRWATHFPVVKRTVLSDNKPLIFFLLHLWILVPLQFRMSKPEAKKTAANCIVKDMRCEIVMMLMRCLQMNVLAASG